MASPQGIQALNFEKNRKWEESTRPKLSVVMIVHRRADLASRAIASFREYCRGSDWELVLVVNGSSPAVLAFVNEQLRVDAYPLAAVFIEECRPGAARNHGVRRARSPLLFFLDDDIECYQDIASAAIELFHDPALQAAGGANLTPPDSGALARATGGMMASLLGAASMRKRYRAGARDEDASEHGLILCNLAVRRTVFESERGFATHMISNEENVLLQRLEGKGARLRSSPRLAVYHCRRDTWSGLCSQAGKYGAGRAQNLLLLPETLSALYFVPLFFLLYLLLLPVLSAIAGAQALLPLALYAALVALHALFLSLSERDPAHLLAVVIFPLVHLSYALGFARALALWSLRRKKLQEHAA